MLFRSTVQEAELGTRILVVSGIAVLMTIGVYGFVAAIVKLDDLGLLWLRSASKLLQGVGRGLLRFAPWLMRALSVVGTAAMFMVGGGIISHGIPVFHHLTEGLEAVFLGELLSTLIEAAIGVGTGALVLGGFTLAGRLRRP